MPVDEISDGMAVEPNHIYVIPPNKRLTIRNGTLRLAPKSEVRGVTRPIDDFSIALAEEQGNAAIGVVLSGTGSDGTYGLKAIKAAGGVTFAQDPKTAEWPDMPMSAITAGSVDFILPPKRIAAELARIGCHPYVADGQEVPEGGDVDRICVILRTASGVDFRLYKQATVRRRIARRMALQKIGSLSKYAQILKQNAQEAKALADDIFIHVTSFFRDAESFQALRKGVLAKFRGNRPPTDPIRIWVAGCSTGEEVYSIAMLLIEELADYMKSAKIQIFGTDIEEKAIEFARAGVYKAQVVAGVTPKRLKRFFSEADSGYQIQKFVRDLCIFARHDLAKDPPFSRLDLISCRNVLIYMGLTLQKRILSTFQHALKADGFLFLGSSESVGEYSDAFAVANRKHRIFLRKPTSEVTVGFSKVDNFWQPPLALPRNPAPSGAVDFRKEAERILLQDYAPPALVVDSELHIVHFQGDMSPYLAPPTGQPSFHLLKMVRPDLMADLRSLVHKAKTQAGAVHKDSLTFKYEGKPVSVGLEIRRLKPPVGKKTDLLVVFKKTEQENGEGASKKRGAHGSNKNAAEITQRVERELSKTREQLHDLIVEHETVQEEMKAANEEIMSSNEELQSTNEELETAKEELQSSNEELTSLNDELQHRNQDLTILMDDLSNLLVGVDIPVLVLDSDLHVRRFTPVAGRLLNLLPGDVGRPFSDIASALAVIDWNGLFWEVKRTGQLIEREVTDRDGHRYLLRLRPYRTSGNDIYGVLVVLFDIDTSKRALEQAQHSRDLAIEAERLSDSILNSLIANVAVLNSDGTIFATNEVWDRFALQNGEPPRSAVAPSNNYLQVCQRAAAEGNSDAQIALRGIQDVLEGHRSFFHFEYPCHFANEKRWFLMNAAPLKGNAGGAVVTHTDITDRKLAEIALQTSESTIRSLLASAAQSVLAMGADGKIVFVNGNGEKMFGYGRDELIGKPLELVIPASPSGQGARQSRPVGPALDIEACRRDGTTFPVEIIFSAIETPQGKLTIAFVSDITQRRVMEQTAEAHVKEVQALAANLLKAQEEERRRVSRELHDQICQQLASLAIDMGGLVSHPETSEHTQRELKVLQTRVVKASDETRHIAYELHSSVLDDLGLVASLQDLTDEFSKTTKIGVKFKHSALPASIPREIASCIYRVAHESVQNVIKHAKAKYVSLSLRARKGSVILAISDNGDGFSLQAVKGRGGLGLIGIEERVRLVGGKLLIETQPGDGTKIAIEIPLPRV